MESNFVLTAFYPIALVARILGYFPFCNLGRRLTQSVQLKCHQLTFDLLLTLIFFGFMLVNDILYVNNVLIAKTLNFRETIYDYFFACVRLSSMIILFHFAFFKQTSVIQFVKHICDIQQMNDFRVKRGVLIKLGYSLSVSVLVLSLIRTVYLESFDSRLTVEQVISLIGTFGNAVAYNFLTAFVVYFNCILRWHFEDLALELNKLCLSYQSVSDFDRRLGAVRRRHEQLIMLTKELNNVLSPIITIYMITQSVSLCVNGCEVAEYIRERLYNLVLGRLVAFLFIRTAPLMAVCMTSDSLSQSAKLNVNIFNQCSFVTLSAESEFQINMLLIQIKRRKAQICADHFFIVDNRLLAQIFGSMATYIVVMIEFESSING
ncbi:hypothetical protein CHUAL_003947 [Chamberlinius hualienensis]